LQSVGRSSDALEPLQKVLEIDEHQVVAIEERDLSISIYLRFVISNGLRASPRWPKFASKLNLQG
jgi:hypothetical protein